MKLSKWLIKNNKDVEGFAKKTLEIRLEDTENKIESYLKNPDEEKLHKVRISMRRLRYSLEIFFLCFKNKNYKKFYKKIENLQVYTGEIRDIDVIKKAINNDFITKSMQITKRKLEKNILIILRNFINSKKYSNFVKMIN